MSKRKLLMYISYLGTNYRGLQLRSSRKTHPDFKTIIPELDTIQGILEQGIRKVLKLKDPQIFNSSRTDTGVHAFSSTVNLVVHDDDFQSIPFSPEQICQSLNLYLEKNETDIRIQRVVEVPLEFSCRKADSRTYTYRIAVARSNDFVNCYSLIRLTPFLPINELYKAQVVSQPFDVKAVQQATRVFLGTWNFRSFASLSSDATQSLRKPNSEPTRPSSGSIRPFVEDDLIKTIYRFSFSASNIEEKDTSEFSFLRDYYNRVPTYEKFDFYDFHVEGSGFLRRQVRRMIGILLSVGRGSLSINDILRMLQNPSEKGWPQNTSTAFPEGLYLKSVNYKKVPVLRGYLS